MVTTGRADRYLSTKKYSCGQYDTLRIPVFSKPSVTQNLNPSKYPIEIKVAEYKKRMGRNYITLEKMAIWELSTVSPGVEINENDPIWERA